MIPTGSRWSVERAQAWSHAHPWPLGCNFLPSTAINQLEMFQPADYDRNRAVLERELDWAAGLGMNTLRVFLHDLLWTTDADGFLRRLEDFLDLCAARRIQPLLVFFDACHRPEPQPGVQPAPTPGIHNPGWAQSPRVSLLVEPARWAVLERYVKDILRRHGADPRILGWDLYNEPCNGGFDGNLTKAGASAQLVGEVFAWAREAAPSQPLTVGVWSPPDPLETHDEDKLDEPKRHLLRAQRLALAHSDIVSFHNYGPPDSLAAHADRLLALGRPVWCTEYMARTCGSFFATCLPVLHERRVGAFNWGFVSGKSQTIFPWRTPEGAPEPELWFHDILRADGTPFDPVDVATLRRLSGRAT